MAHNVLVIGSGAREQALAWKLAQSSQVGRVYVAPGNGGSRGNIENVDIAFTDVDGLLDFAHMNSVDLTVVGQEAAYEAGVVDAFIEAGLAIFGPTKEAGKIETSKVLSKDLMSGQDIPTAAYRTFNDPNEAIAYAQSRPLPVVIKADGLAEGKGVVICFDTDMITNVINTIMVKKVFGQSGNQIVVEDFLKGQEVSIHALSDGHQSVIFPASQDHKQIYDGDQGPNTGGMGVYAPVPWVTAEHLQTIKDRVVQPALLGLDEKGSKFKGVLYPGLMIDGDTINVIEFNARFGDPEAEVYMRLFEGDLYEVLTDCAHGQLDPSTVSWKSGYAVDVALASGGYPGKYQKGLPISGVDQAEQLEDVVVFHAGTKLEDGQLVTNGGRVLNVTATGATLDKALAKAYQAVACISFEGMHYRTDIGRRPK